MAPHVDWKTRDGPAYCCFVNETIKEGARTKEIGVELRDTKAGVIVGIGNQGGDGFWTCGSGVIVGNGWGGVDEERLQGSTRWRGLAKEGNRTGASGCSIPKPFF